MHLKALITAAALLAITSPSLAFDAKSDFAFSDKASTEQKLKEVITAYNKAVTDDDFLLMNEYGEQAYKLSSDILGPEHKHTMALTDNVFRRIQYHNPDEKKEPSKDLLFKLSELEKQHGKHSENIVETLMEAGFSASHSWPYFKRALKIIKKSYGKSSFQYFEANLSVGKFYFSKYGHAESYFHAAYRAIEQKIDQVPPAQLADLFFRIGNCYERNSYRYLRHEKRLKKLEDYFSSIPASTFDEITARLLVKAFSIRENKGQVSKHIKHLSSLTSSHDDQLLYAKWPDYEFEKYAYNPEGYVTLSYRVSSEGFIVDPKVRKLKGTATYKSSAIEAIKHFAFLPAHDRTEVSEERRIRIYFPYNRGMYLQSFLP